MIQVGDWVKVYLWEYHLIGFVECVGKDSIVITKVFKVADGEKQRVSQRPGTYDFDQVEPLPSDLCPEDLGELINMALDTKDEAWFEELARIQTELQALNGHENIKKGKG
ncbi:IDEAL domain-containing protein [Bacillus smithii]|uniref:IDEAL domain-containing protein n=1 Tax=Bacillus smithii TaxID=1479 RepID=UPI002E1A1BE2|nr:IDEAL domain-containing protein [Bacillus smithii]MED1456631.1 IDEAL domain-containing protein [Bacillus smithii]